MECDLKISELFQAYYDCRKTKRNTWNALKFEQNLERNLMDLYYELTSQKYTPGRSIMFVVTRPKSREIWAAEFKDRIVHHILYNRYAKTFYNRFIFDSYACIPEKGTLKAAQRLQKFMQEYKSKDAKQTFFLKVDISNFFVSINKNILDKLLAKHIKDNWWIWLARRILYADPRLNVYIKSPTELLNKIPKHKSLLLAPDSLGLPIGNLSSQFFANIYLNELDQFAKHVLKLKHYVRYVDDIVILSKSSFHLFKVSKNINDFLNKNLYLSLHPKKTQINCVDYGVNFVGYIVKPFCKYLRRSTVNNMYQKVYKNKKDALEMRASVNSYFGILRSANSFKERQRLVNKLSELNYSFDSKLTKLVLTGENK
jgi:hypothetical protein